MNYTGREVIEAVVRRLNDKDIRCYDSAIVAVIADLNRQQLSELITFGDLTKWINERNDKSKQNP